MIYAIALDDNVQSIGIYQAYTDRVHDFDLVGIFNNREDALEMVDKDERIGLLIVDQGLIGSNGSSILHHLPAGVQVIITNAMNATKSEFFTPAVVDRIPKHFTFDQFDSALQKVSPVANPFPEPAHADLNFSSSYWNRKFLLIKNEHKLTKLAIDEILYIEGKGNYVSFHTTRVKLLSLQNMRKLEELLKPYLFVRIHKSFIVSFAHLESIQKNGVSVGKIQIPIGDSYRESFEAFLAKNVLQL
jgi:DNA-binding LytR/AlgR family response regulator